MSIITRAGELAEDPRYEPTVSDGDHIEWVSEVLILLKLLSSSSCEEARKLVELGEKATPADWNNGGGVIWVETATVRAEPRCCQRAEHGCGGRGCTGPEPEYVQEPAQEQIGQMNDADAEFACHARNHAPHLALRLIALEAENEDSKSLRKMWSVLLRVAEQHGATRNPDEDEYTFLARMVQRGAQSAPR